MFLCFQLGTAAALDGVLWRGRDPEFAAKLGRLQALVQTHPDQPLVLFLGSSRTLMAFQAGSLSAQVDGRPALAFNFGIRGAGPLLELICLKRLLAAGIRPDVLYVEVIPAVLNQRSSHPLEEEWLGGGRLTLAEILACRRLHSQPTRLVRHWLKSRWAPCSAYRRGLRDYVFDPDPEGTGSWRDPEPGVQDDYGWQPFFENGMGPDRQAYFLDIARKQYDVALGEYSPCERSMKSLEELLELCARREIPVRLIAMPEGRTFRALQCASMTAGIEAYLTELCDRRGIPFVDARGWLADDAFWDSHHQLPRGAEQFTRLFAEELGVQRP